MLIKDLFKLEIKLILRNIRPKILLSSIFLVPNLLTSSAGEHYPILKLATFIFSTGSFFTYSQFWLAWDSTYFNFLMTVPCLIKSYVEAKFWLNFIYAVMTSVILSLFFFQIHDFFLYLMVALLYNVGINSYLMLYSASFNVTKMNIWKSEVLFEGNNTPQFISTSLFLGFPSLLYATFNFLFSHQTTMLIIGVLGLFSLFCYKPVIEYLVKNLTKRKKILFESYNTQ